MRPLRSACEIAVIGGGMAGLSAAWHAARLGHSVVLFEGSGLYGGQIATVGRVDGVSVPGDFSGQDLAIGLLEKLRQAGVHVVEAGVTRVDTVGKVAVRSENGETVHPAVVIVASGGSRRRLGVPGEDAFTGRGLSHCATCDGGFFRGGDVVVVGGGDSALQEALILAVTSRRVLMVCRGPLRARRDYVERLASRDNVTFIWDSEISEIVGESGVTGVLVRNVKEGTISSIECTGIFPFIGTEPNTAFMPKALLSQSGHVKTGGDLATADQRLFAIGAVRQGYGGQIVQAIAEGFSAAEAAAGGSA